MQARKFRGKNIKDVFEQVKKELGADAVILSQKEVKNLGVEIIATSLTQDSNLFIDKSSHKSKDVFASVYQEQETKSEQTVENTPAQSRNVRHEQGYRKSSSNLETNSTGPISHHTSQALDKSHSHIQGTQGTSSEQKLAMKPIEVAHKTSSSIEYNIKDPTMDKVREDLATIRSMLEEKLDYLQVHEKFKTKPLSHLIYDKLKQFGCSNSVAEELASDINQSWSEQEAWNAVLNQLQKKLQTSPKILPQHKGNLIFLGSSGAGKTTLLLKVLVSYLQLYTTPKIAVISFDHKIGAQAMLSRFCELLSIPLLLFDTNCQLEQALEMNKKFDLILVDTPSLWPFDLRWANQYLNKCQNPEAIYTLSGTLLQQSMEKNIQHHKKLFPKLAVITKEDETSSLGHCLSLSLEYNFSLVGISSGDNISEGFKRLRSFELVDLAQKLFDKSTTSHQSEYSSPVLDMP